LEEKWERSRVSPLGRGEVNLGARRRARDRYNGGGVSYNLGRKVAAEKPRRCGLFPDADAAQVPGADRVPPLDEVKK
jgi:hypothetical protein